jgi:hypothetical protein
MSESNFIAYIKRYQIQTNYTNHTNSEIKPLKPTHIVQTDFTLILINVPKCRIDEFIEKYKLIQNPTISIFQII